MSQEQKNRRGILMMLLAMAFFVGNDALVKLARVQWEAGQVLVVRGVFALLLLAAWLAISGFYRQIGMMFGPYVLLRGGLEALIAILFISALGAMHLADITAILMLAPLIITALSMVLFGEQVGWRRWLAVLVGFCGMLLVIRPGGHTIPLGAAFMALLSVIGVGFRDALTRRIPAQVPSIVATLTSSVGTFLGGLALVGFGQAWRPFEWPIAAGLFGAAIIVLIANFAVIEAHRESELSVVSPFRFTVIGWAMLLGIVVFGEWPMPIALLGIALIAASGLYTLHRERVRRAG